MGSVMEVSSVFSLKCPLGQKRMRIPVKGRDCRHVEPFDRDTFLEFLKIYSVQSRRSASSPPSRVTCPCPVCSRPLSEESIVEDGLFQSILKQVPESCLQVLIHGDRSFRPCEPVASSPVVSLSSDRLKRPRSVTAPSVVESDLVWIKSECSEPQEVLKRVVSLLFSLPLQPRSNNPVINRILGRVRQPLSVTEQYLRRIEARRKERFETLRLELEEACEAFLQSSRSFAILDSLSADQTILLFDTARELKLFAYPYGREDSADMVLFRSDPGVGTDVFLESSPSEGAMAAYVEARVGSEGH